MVENIPLIGRGFSHTYDRIEAIKSDKFTADDCRAAINHDDKTGYLGKTARKAVEVKLRNLEKSAKPLSITITLSEPEPNSLRVDLASSEPINMAENSPLISALRIMLKSISDRCDEIEAIKSDKFTADDCRAAINHDDKTGYLGKTARKAVEVKLRNLEKSAKPLSITITLSEPEPNSLRVDLASSEPINMAENSPLISALRIMLKSISDRCDEIEAIKSDKFTADDCRAAINHDDKTGYLGKTARKAVEVKLRNLEKSAKPLSITITLSEPEPNSLRVDLASSEPINMAENSPLISALRIMLKSISDRCDETVVIR